MNDLVKWKDSPRRKPLVLQGARQVGKSWVVEEFGEKYYDDCFVINFEKDNNKENYFSNGFNPVEIIKIIEILNDVKITPGKTLLFFDEIQESNDALKSLKYFNEQANDYHIIAAGSFLGVKLHQNSSFPVGKVNFLKMYPMTFTEFLLALGQKDLVDLLNTNHLDQLKPFSNKLINTLKQYYFIGGMPEVVKSYIENNDYNQVKVIQNELTQSYINDFSKHAPLHLVPKITAIFNTIPYQLSLEKKKFKYSNINKNSRAKDYEEALEWLENIGLIIKVNRTSKIGVPLKFYLVDSAFKLFYLDVGLLSYALNIQVDSIYKANDLFVEFNGALAEQYVIQQLLNDNYTFAYYMNENSTNEIDFLLDYNNKVIPIEVKSGFNTKAKSLHAFIKKYQPEISIRTSLNDYTVNENLYDIPLYCMDGLYSYLSNLE